MKELWKEASLFALDARRGCAPASWTNFEDPGAVPPPTPYSGWAL